MLYKFAVWENWTKNMNLGNEIGLPFQYNCSGAGKINKYYFIIIFFTCLNINAQDPFEDYYYSEEEICIYYNAVGLTNEEKESISLLDSETLYLRIFNYFDDSVSLMIGKDFIYSGKFKATYDDDYAGRYFNVSEYKDGRPILLKYISHKYKTKIEVPIDTRFGCVILDFDMDDHLPPEDWNGFWPIQCIISYQRGSCFGP